MKLIADGLDDEREEDDHPKPVGSAKTRAIEQREGGKERTAEGDERGERKLPFAARGVDDQTALVGSLAKFKDEGIGSLHEEQEDQQGSQQ